ncbi:MAG: type II secretion system protein [Candidatus Aminicenantes bacterium]|nr:type II secretion system protein [Candidatus Aminicenantes bacterium]MCK5004692.1 type II secretion system protein [Candidatus Aminicenantes bacterium]
MKRGFTLVEILIVMTIIGILLSIVIPQYKNSIIKAKEAVLKENLFQIRDSISKYYKDKNKYPVSLEDLVVAKYLRSVPVDPFSNKPDWELIRNEPVDFEDFDMEDAEGIIDIKSISNNPREEGKGYGEW